MLQNLCRRLSTFITRLGETDGTHGGHLAEIESFTEHDAFAARATCEHPAHFGRSHNFTHRYRVGELEQFFKVCRLVAVRA